METDPKCNPKLLDTNIEEIGGIGYFAALNLNYDCTDTDIRRNYEEIFRQLQSSSTGNDKENHTEHNENILTQKLDMQARRKLLRRVVDAFRILENENLRRQYIEDIKLRSYFSQAVSMDQLYSKYSGRIFPFFMCELFSKEGGTTKLKSKILYVNFIQRVMEERKGATTTKFILFDSIKHVSAGEKPEEIYLVTKGEHKDKNFTLHVKYIKQRNLVVEVITYAKLQAEKKQAQKEKAKMDPFLKYRSSNNAAKEHSESGTDKAKDGHKGLKLLVNDRVCPARKLFECEVYLLRKKVFTFRKRFWMHIGCSQILISTNRYATDIVKIFPIDKEYMSIIKSPKAGCFNIICQKKKTKFQAIIKDDVDVILDLMKDISEEKVPTSSVVYSIPYNKKDPNIVRMLLRRLKEIELKISEMNNNLSTLKVERDLIKDLFVRENSKAVADPDISDITTLNNISAIGNNNNNKPAGNVCSLEYIENSFSLTPSPNITLPFSKTITDDNAGSSISSKPLKSDAHYITLQNKMTKGTSFSEKLKQITIFNMPHLRHDDYVSPDFRKRTDFNSKDEIVEHPGSLDDKICAERGITNPKDIVLCERIDSREKGTLDYLSENM